MNKMLLVFGLFFCFQCTLIAQNDSLEIKRPPSISEADFTAMQSLEDTLGVLGYAIVNDSLPENRFGSCRQFIPILVKALKHKNSFDYKFSRLNSISILNSPDSTFRIFTWQLYVDKDDYRYYGAIQMNKEELELFPLVDRSYEIESPDFDEVDNKNWFGSIYYNLKAFDTPQGKKYLVFGFDGNTFFNKKKVIDVIQFKDGKPVFGAPVFHRSAESTNHPPVKHRVIKEYYAEARVKLNFDEVHNAIVMDHVIEMGRKDQLYQVPDGTYEGYKLTDGKWVHVEKMFDHVFEQGEPPRPEPIFIDDKKKKKVKRKDIFGNK